MNEIISGLESPDHRLIYDLSNGTFISHPKKNSLSDIKTDTTFLETTLNELVLRIILFQNETPFSTDDSERFSKAINFRIKHLESRLTGIRSIFMFSSTKSHIHSSIEKLHHLRNAILETPLNANLNSILRGLTHPMYLERNLDIEASPIKYIAVPRTKKYHRLSYHLEGLCKWFKENDFSSHKDKLQHALDERCSLLRGRVTGIRSFFMSFETKAKIRNSIEQLQFLKHQLNSKVQATFWAIVGGLDPSQRIHWGCFIEECTSPLPNTSAKKEYRHYLYEFKEMTEKIVLFVKQNKEELGPNKDALIDGINTRIQHLQKRINSIWSIFMFSSTKTKIRDSIEQLENLKTSVKQEFGV